MTRWPLLLLSVSSALLLAPASRHVHAAPPSFEHEVLPILKAKCLSCHGKEKTQSDLDLRTLATTLTGGASGKPVEPGKPDDSLLWQMIEAEEMPPSDSGHTPLTPQERTVVRRWIETGNFQITESPGDEIGPIKIPEERRKFWSFQKPVKAPTPKVKGTDRVRTPIDAFILQRLEAKGLTFRPDASRETLIRRLSFDLTGLPPTPAEIDAFVKDKAPDAYEMVVDRLLASPHYGERWGRHWLDVAGYADSNGRRGDETRINSWMYRDWVIRALNADMPFDQFVTKQLAGDELVDWRTADALTPDMVDKLVATGFLRCAPDATDNEMVDQVDDRYATLHDTVEISMKALLGLTVGCAKCHNHKYDPIPQADFYRIAACFQPAYNPDNWLPANKRTFRDDNLRYLPKASAKERARIEELNKPIDAEVARLKKQLVDETAKSRQAWFDAELAKLPAPIREDVRAALSTPKEKQSAVAAYLAEKFAASLTITDVQLRKASAPFAEQATKIEAEIAKQEKSRPPVPQRLWVLWDMSPQPPPSPLLKRGDYKTPGRNVGPGVLSVLEDPKSPYEFPAPDAKQGTTGRRLALAKWITRPDHPLTSRVLVNRLWQRHFGKGIVTTIEDFGTEGARPTHPELLDWLAVSFVENGWSLKKLHRLMLLSSVYRQSAEFDPTANSVDPANDLWWRKVPLRLEAEIVRDAMLAVSGSLNPKQFGEAIDVKQAPDGQWIEAPTEGNAGRRSVYLLNKRTESVTFLNIFDLPVMELNCPERFQSTVPLQALSLLNNEFVIGRAKSFAERVAKEAGAAPAKQVDVAFRLAFGRAPDADEQAACVAFLSRKPEGAADQSTALTNFCQTLLGSNEFLYID